MNQNKKLESTGLSIIKSPRLHISLVLLGGVVFSLVLFVASRHGEFQRIRQTFEVRSEDHISAINRELEATLQDLDTLRALGTPPRPDKFRQVADDLLGRGSGIVGLAWAPLAGAPPLTPAAGGSASAQTAPLELLEPLSGDRSWRGLDLASWPPFAGLLEKAATSEGMLVLAAAGPLPSLRDGDMLAVLPIHRAGQGAEAPGGGETPALAGLYLASIQTGKVVETALRALSPRGLDVWVYAGPQAAQEALRYEHHSRSYSSGAAVDPSLEVSSGQGLRYVRVLNEDGAHWTVVCQPAPGYVSEARTWYPWLFLVYGLAGTVVVTVYFLLVASYSARIVALNQDMNQEMALRRSMEQELFREKERFATIVEQAPLGVSLIGQDGRYQYINPMFVATFGHEVEEYLHGRDWFERAFPDPAYRRRVMDIWQDDLANAKTGQARVHNFSMTCHDGSVKEILFRAVTLLDGSQLVLYEDITQHILMERRLRESEARFRSLTDSLPLLIWEAGPDGMITYVNLTWTDFTGRQAARELGLGFMDNMHPDDLEGFRQAHARSQTQHLPFEIEYRLLRSDGQYRWLLCNGVPRFGSEGGFLGYLGSCLDITVRKNFELQQRMIAQVFENTVEGIVIADGEGRVQMVNPAFSEITGYSAQEVMGREFDILRPDPHDPTFYEDVWEGLVTTGRWSGEYWNRRKNGQAYPEWLTIGLIRDPQGQTNNFMAIFHDITEIKRSQDQLHHQANHDALTGLPNRLLFRDRLSQALAHAKRNSLQLALLFIDLDNFKHINDSMGHEVGDLLLKEVAGRLVTCVREEDTVARLGGDEFTLVLHEVKGERGAVQVARKVLESLARPMNLKDNEVRIGASIGITLYPADGEDLASLLRNADMAMYRAKRQGRNTYQLFTSTMQEEAVQAMALENAMRRALEEEEFTVYYQPRLEIKTQRIMGMEALVRWDHPTRGLLAPGVFINLAEETGMILAMGEFVLRRACREAQAWRQAGNQGLCVSVNLSPRQFEQENLVAMVEEVLLETGLPSIYLELEITEGAVMKSVDKAVATLVDLAAMGVRLSLDDFGTGYSSLNYLKRFPLSALKIDQSFVRDLNRDPNDAAIVQTIIAMGHTLDLQVVAEGVETAEQLAFLSGSGCDEFQGYLFSRPLPAAQFGELLTTYRPSAPPEGSPSQFVEF